MAKKGFKLGIPGIPDLAFWVTLQDLPYWELTLSPISQHFCEAGGGEVLESIPEYQFM